MTSQHFFSASWPHPCLDVARYDFASDATNLLETNTNLSQILSTDLGLIVTGLQQKKKEPATILLQAFLHEKTILRLCSFHFPRVFPTVGVGVCPDKPFIVQPFDVEGNPAG